MIPLMSISGGGDQVKERATEPRAIPFNDCGGDDGAAKEKTELKFCNYCALYC